MGLIHVSAVRDDASGLLATVRELGAEKLILLEGDEEAPSEVGTVLAPLGVDLEHRTVEGSMLLGTLQQVQRVAREHRDRREDLVVNLAAAGRYQSCALLSAAFVSGLRTVDLVGGKVQFMPTLNFSYDEVVGGEKLEILQGLEALDGQADGVRELAGKTSLGTDRVVYQVRGGKEEKGLEELGLVEVGQEDGIVIRLTPMGETLARGMRLSPARSNDLKASEG